MECQKERKDLYHGISSARKETFSFNERSGRVFFLPSLSAVAVRQQLQCKNQVSRMKTRTRATALIQKKKEECPVTLRTRQEKQIPPRQFLQLKTWSKGDKLYFLLLFTFFSIRLQSNSHLYDRMHFSYMRAVIAMTQHTQLKDETDAKFYSFSSKIPALPQLYVSFLCEIVRDTFSSMQYSYTPKF